MNKKRIVISVIAVCACVIAAVEGFLTVKGGKAAEMKKNGRAKEDRCITSAVQFFADPETVIEEKNITDKSRLKDGDVGQIDGIDYYFGSLPNIIPTGRFAMRKLNKNESHAILTAPDLTELSSFQAECLSCMLTWDSEQRSVIDVSPHTEMVQRYKAIYYYMEDRTVILVVDFALRSQKINPLDKSWILVIPEGEEDAYPFDIPPAGTYVNPYDEDVGSYEHYYKELKDWLSDRFLKELEEAGIDIYETGE
jgi:hypothetical protein